MYSSIEYCHRIKKTDMADKFTKVQESVQKINIILMLKLRVYNFDKLFISIYLSFNFMKKHFEYTILQIVKIL